VAEKGHNIAQTYLGCIYERGEEIKKNFKKAFY